MLQTDFTLDLKSIEDDGTVEGLAAGYGNIDLGGDLFLPGALSKSIKGKLSTPMLLYHDMQRPAGVWETFVEVPDGLLVKGRFAMSTIDGKEAHALVKAGALKGLSVGYRSLADKIVGKVRQISEAALHEISLVTVPMNEKTLVLNFKDIIGAGDLPSLPEFEKFLREAGFSKSQATAIAGKGLSHLFRSESGSATEDAAKFFAAIKGTSPLS